MRDAAFTLGERDLIRPQAPFAYTHDPKRAQRWLVTDARGDSVAEARTRAGARAAVRTLHGAA